MKLIDLDEIKKYPIRLNSYDKEHGNRDFVLGIESLMEYIENLPTVDAVEVVRCKDCVSYGITTNNGNPLSYMCGACGQNDFCSNGVRKDDSSKN